MLVDTDHAGDEKSHRSRSDFLMHINTALVKFCSKNQSKVETSVFGAKFLTVKQGIISITTSDPSYIYYKMPVVHNTTRPESVHKKKSNSICSDTVH